MEKWAAVVGDPVAHSLSPVLHKKAYEILGLDWDYRKIQVDTWGFEQMVSSLGPECIGLSVTAPLKRAVLKVANTVDGLAKMVGAANTLVFSTSISAAFNTDVQGIVDTVRPLLDSDSSIHSNLFLTSKSKSGPLAGQAAPVVLGTGATASSALAAVRSLGATSVVLVGRSFAGPDNAFAIANKMGLDVHPLLWKRVPDGGGALGLAPLIISTVPPHVTAELSSYFKPRDGATVLDVTYSAGTTPLEEAFVRVGGRVGSPLAMLTHQGIAQVKLWTNQEVPYQPVYEAVLAAAQK